MLLKSIKPVPNSLFGACDPLGVQLLTRLRVGLSHLKVHKFNHGFNDTIDPMCACNTEIESVFHFYLRCPFYINQRFNLMNDLSNLGINTTPSMFMMNFLLYGDKSFCNELNLKILQLSIQYIKDTKRFDGPLL